MAEIPILLASANPASWYRIKDALEDQFAITFAVDIQGTLDVLKNQNPTLLVLCSRLLDANLEQALEVLRKHITETRVIVILEKGGKRPVDKAALWADAYLEEDLAPAALLAVVQAALGCAPQERRGHDRRRPDRQGPDRRRATDAASLSSHPAYRQMVVDSNPQMRKLMEVIQRISAADASVLITGETGTGKEVLARYIHCNSPRAGGPFKAVDLPAVPDDLFESILFGHERGAFTGAVAPSQGKFMKAHHGSLFLDEISSLKLELQPKLLRAIQEKEVESVGSREPTACDVRIIAATNQSLKQAVKRGEFRADLYYRINVIPLMLPPLRQRKDELPALADHFINSYAEQYNRGPARLSTKGLVALENHGWPGNIRELENRIQRALLLSSAKMLGPEELFCELDEGMEQPAMDFGECTQNLAEMEARYIEQVLEKTGGNQSQAAQILQIDRKTLRAKLQKYSDQLPEEQRGLRAIS